MAGCIKSMRLNGGQLFLQYDNSDTFARVHSSDSISMSRTLSAFKFEALMHPDKKNRVTDPHMVIHVSCHPENFVPVFKPLLRSGLAQCFLLSNVTTGSPPPVSRNHFQTFCFEALEALETDLIVQRLFEDLTRVCISRITKGIRQRCEYSLVVESLMAKFDQMVCV